MRPRAGASPILLAFLATAVAGQEPPAATVLGSPAPLGRLAGPLQRALEAGRDSLGARGASAAVIFPDGQIWVGTSGEARAGVPLVPGALFEVGSVTKTYTAAVLVRLHEEGVLSLDDPVARWVEDSPAPDGVTLRMLLRHTSGIADVMSHPEMIPALIARPGRRWTSRELFEYVGPPAFEPGEGWAYSNTGFHLAGMAAESASGRPFHELLEELLGPLELPRTTYAAVREPRPPRAHAFLDVNGDGTADDLTALVPPTSFLTAAGPAGAVMTTAEELVRWVRALHNGAVLGAEGYAALTDLVDRPDGRRYGLGTLVDRYDGVDAFGHEGNSAGFSAAAWHLPARGLTLAVLTNAHQASVAPVTRALLAALAGRD